MFSMNIVTICEYGSCKYFFHLVDILFKILQCNMVSMILFKWTVGIIDNNIYGLVDSIVLSFSSSCYCLLVIHFW